MTDPKDDLPEPAFRLTWRGERGAYFVDKPGIDSTDCYTPDQIRAYLSEGTASLKAENERLKQQRTEAAIAHSEDITAMMAERDNFAEQAGEWMRTANDFEQELIALRTQLAEAQKDAQRLHAEIMNIPCKPWADGLIDFRSAYWHGHKDARHAAAELALTPKEST